MRVIKRFLFSFLFILCFSASAYGQRYSTIVDIYSSQNVNLNVMSDVKLTIWIDNNVLWVRLDKYPETEQGVAWFFSRKDYSSFNSNVDTESGYHAFSLVRRDARFSYVNSLFFSVGLDKSGATLPFHAIDGAYYEIINGQYVLQNNKYDKYFVKITQKQFTDIRQFIIEEADGCFYEYNPKWYDNFWETNKFVF